MVVASAYRCYYLQPPPYIKASSEARHFDLTLMRAHPDTTAIYRWRDTIINGAGLFRQENPCQHDPATAMGTLLGG